MPRFVRNKYLISLWTTTLLILASIFIFNLGSSRTLLARNVVNTVFVPLQKLFVCFGYEFNLFIVYFSNNDILLSENERLNKRVEELVEVRSELERLVAENEMLREVVAVNKTAPEFRVINAEVISRDFNNWYSVFTIDKGSQHGIQRKQPVINVNKALVGYISEVGFNWSKITAIIDPSSAAGAILMTTRQSGIVEGDVSLRKCGMCKLTYVSKNSDISIGESIETSGLGGLYPKGVLVGVVKEINPDIHSISQYAVVEPTVNFSKLTRVFVIKDTLESN